LILALLVGTVATPRLVLAAEALTYDHIHISVTDTKAATAWYIKHLGATARPDGMDGVFFGRIRFNVRQTDTIVPSHGTLLESVGLSYASLAERMRALDGSGARIIQAPREVAGVPTAIIEDPWGVRIELVQDPALLGFHHVRLRTTDPGAMLAWFTGKLGGQPATSNWASGLKFGGIWLIVEKADAEPAPSANTAIDHLGFRTKDIKAAVADFTANGVKVLGDPRQDRIVATTFATNIEGLPGRVELTMRPDEEGR
jgi:catechol 2,3-dioxygenase-like lactoylglutathione lyase family enzyme